MIDEPFIVTNLKDVYHHEGEFEFRLVVDTEIFDQTCSPKLIGIDSSGKQIRCNTRLWGTKLKCQFVIDETVSDGIAMFQVSLVSKSGEQYQKTVNAWVIK